MISFSLWASATVFKTKEMLNQLNHSIHQYSICFVLLSWPKSFNLQLRVRKKMLHSSTRKGAKPLLCTAFLVKQVSKDSMPASILQPNFHYPSRFEKSRFNFFFYFCVCFFFFIFPSLVLVTSSPFSIPRSQFFVSVRSQWVLPEIVNAWKSCVMDH